MSHAACCGTRAASGFSNSGDTVNISLNPVPGFSFSDAMPKDGWEGKLLAKAKSAFHSHGHKFLAESRRNTPISPSLERLVRLGNGGGQYTLKATTKRPARLIKSTDYYKPATILAAMGAKASELGVNPGGLMRSIMLETGDDYAEVFVASNSEGAAYAVKIHDEKGVTWKHRGPGTQAKGPQADDKFIERAWDVWREKLEDRIKQLFFSVFKFPKG